MDDDLAWSLEQERRIVLLLSRNQSERQHVEAAGRHVVELGRLLKIKVAAVGRACAPSAATGRTVANHKEDRASRMRS